MKTDPPPQVEDFNWIWRKWFSTLWQNINNSSIQDDGDSISIIIDDEENISVGGSELTDGLGTDGSWIQLGDGAYLNGAKAGVGSGWFDLAQNNYYDNVAVSYKYTHTGAASTIELANGGLWLGVIGSGTAGDNISFTTALNITSAAAISGACIKDEDDMASDSAVHLASQQSIKAYVDNISSLEQTVSANSTEILVTDSHDVVRLSAASDYTTCYLSTTSITEYKRIEVFSEDSAFVELNNGTYMDIQKGNSIKLSAAAAEGEYSGIIFRFRNGKWREIARSAPGAAYVA